MRRKKRENRFAPYFAGMIVGYAVILIVILAGAGLISMTENPTAAASAVAIPALALGCFLCGKTAGAIKRQGGLKTGFLCGILMFAPVAAVSLFAGMAEGMLMAVKAAVCLCFSTAGGVSGVNARE